MNLREYSKVILVNRGNNPVFWEIIDTVGFHLQQEGFDIYEPDRPLTGAGVDGYQPGAIYILFNSHVPAYNFDFTLPYIVFNYEQAGSPYVRYPHYLFRMKHAKAVFDYSTFNLKFLQGIIETPIKILPYVYQPGLTQLPLRKDNAESIDVLFYGVSNPHREQFRAKLAQSSLRVEFITNYSCFGDTLVSKMSATKIILNLHYYINPSILEITRIIPALSNHKIVVSEYSSDADADARFAPMVEFVTLDTIVEVCETYVKDFEKRLAKNKSNFLHLTKVDPTTQQFPF